MEPTGPFEDDPNVTDKEFPGNPTWSYRSRHPLRITGEVHDRQGHDREALATMLHSLRLLREQGRDLIEDRQGLPRHRRSGDEHAERVALRVGERGPRDVVTRSRSAW